MACPRRRFLQHFVKLDVMSLWSSIDKMAGVVFSCRAGIWGNGTYANLTLTTWKQTFSGIAAERDS